MAKWWTTDLLNRVADRCLQLHGGYGYMREYPVGRAWLSTCCIARTDCAGPSHSTRRMDSSASVGLRRLDSMTAL